MSRGEGPLTPEDVRDEIERIRGLIGDPEAAHSAEDDLRTKVLQAIADKNAEDPNLCAFVALQTSELDFPRWCA